MYLALILVSLAVICYSVMLTTYLVLKSRIWPRYQPNHWPLASPVPLSKEESNMVLERTIKEILDDGATEQEARQHSQTQQ